MILTDDCQYKQLQTVLISIADNEKADALWNCLNLKGTLYIEAALRL